MKVDGITLLQMIRDGKIKEDTKINGEGIKNCSIKYVTGIYDTLVFINKEFELIEEENKEIDLLGDGSVNMETQEEIYSFKTNNEKALKNKINELVRAVNNLIKE
jgi:hypothetical protein